VDLHPTDHDDVLALPARARLLLALSELRRPSTTHELAAIVGRHPNTVRRNLQLMADAGLVERRTERQVRGRPRDEWAISAGARPMGEAPQAHGELGRWLARVLRTQGELEAVERAGREIGRELAPEASGRPAAAALRDTLIAMGFAPEPEPTGPGAVRYVLGNCPYRDAVRENQPVVCSLHRGITQGVLDRLAPDAELTAFVPKDPDRAGCLVGVERLP